MPKKSAVNYYYNSRPFENEREFFNLIESDCQKEIFAEKEESVFSTEEDLTHVDESVSGQRDIEFCELYFKVIDKQLARGNYEENIKKAECEFRKIRSRANKWCRFRKRNDSKQIIALKSSFYYRMLCIYSNATCISSAVAYHFEHFLNRNLKPFKNVLKICSVGGGLPADIVAFVKVLGSYIDIKDVQIHVTVIDVDKKWKKPCLAILQSLENFDKEKWKIDFVPLDLSSTSISPNIETAIKEADLVSFLNFLDLTKDKVLGFKSYLFQKLHRLVSKGSVLFLMDHADFEVMSVFGGYLGRLHGHKLLYDVVCHLHTLQQSTVERHYHLYNKHLLTSGMSNTSFKLFCRVWVKTEETFNPQIKRDEKRLQAKVWKAWQGQLHSFCYKLRNLNFFNNKVDGKDVFFIRMRNQERRQKKIRYVLEPSERDLVLKEIFGIQLIFPPYQYFLEEETREALKKEKRIDFNKKMKTANLELKTYDASIKKLLHHLAESAQKQPKPMFFINIEKCKIFYRLSQ